MNEVILNDNNGQVLDLSIKVKKNKKDDTLNDNDNTSIISATSSSNNNKKKLITQGNLNGSGNKKQMRYKCKFCVYKSHSISLMQNHIYRHIDKTPYSCYYCGHKSTTKSTIMVHIELCHPNMNVKINENRVKEDDYFIDLFNQNVEDEQQQSIDGCDNEIKRDNQVVSLISPLSNTNTTTVTSPSLSNCSSPKLDDTDVEQHHEMDDKLIIEEDGEQHTQREEEHQNNGHVINRPKQYFGSLYEPDKQYSCKLCSYTTNHKPSMEDHVYVHTNKRPYRCGYCNEEIYTRYAATYHNKYKHPGEKRNFIKDEQDVSKFYVNRAAANNNNNNNNNKSKQVPLQEEHANNNNTTSTKISSNNQLVNNKVNRKTNNNQVKKCQNTSLTQNSINAQVSPVSNNTATQLINNSELNTLMKYYQTQLQNILISNFLMNNLKHQQQSQQEMNNCNNIEDDDELTENDVNDNADDDANNDNYDDTSKKSHKRFKRN